MVPYQVDRMIGCEVFVYLWMRPAKADGVVAPVVRRLLLLDDVSLDGHRKVIGLSRQVSGTVIVHPLVFEGGIAEICPQERDHSQLMCIGKSLTYLHDLAT